MLQHSFNDFAISQVAKALGKMEDAAKVLSTYQLRIPQRLMRRRSIWSELETSLMFGTPTSPFPVLPTSLA